MSAIKETKVYNINDFLNWYDNGELEISPKYQRNSVWNLKAKSYLIDSIVRGLPIPQLFIRQTVDTSTRKTLREVIDGQQRLRAITEFVDNQYPVSKAHNKEFGGKSYSDFSDDEKEAFLLYEMPVEIIKSRDDAVIYNMFSRVNTNSVTLNKQELRNATYWGDFKVFIYELSETIRNFFIEHKTFTDKQFSRMLDIEFISSLVILILDGVISESQTVIDSYYKRYDESFERSDEVEEKFSKVISIIDQILENVPTSYFHRKNYLFTLFSFLLHQLYGFNNCEEIERDRRFNVDQVDFNISDIFNKISLFESDYERFMKEEFYNQDIAKDLIKFEQHHRTRTTSQKERVERLKIITQQLI